VLLRLLLLVLVLLFCGALLMAPTLRVQTIQGVRILKVRYSSR
jgi:hypothetical protein